VSVREPKINPIRDAAGENECGPRFKSSAAQDRLPACIDPEHLHAFSLIDEMRLAIEHDGHQPVGVLERDQPSGAGLVAGEGFHGIEEPRIATGNGERLPERFDAFWKNTRSPSSTAIFASLLSRATCPCTTASSSSV